MPTMHSVLSIAVAALVAGSVGVVVRDPAAVNGKRPQALITAPPDGAKIRPGQVVPVRVRVQAGASPLASWSLQLRAADGRVHALASGSERADREVALVRGDDLAPGQRVTLELQATDRSGVTSTHRTTHLVPNPQYTLIPLEPGDNSRGRYCSFAMDRSGKIVVRDGSDGAVFHHLEIFNVDKRADV